MLTGYQGLFSVLYYNNSTKWNEVAQSCLTLCNPMDCSLPGSSIQGIFQARILEWVVISFSRRSPQPRDWTWVSRTVGRHFTLWAIRKVNSSTKRVLKWDSGRWNNLLRPLHQKAGFLIILFCCGHRGIWENKEMWKQDRSIFLHTGKYVPRHAGRELTSSFGLSQETECRKSGPSV